MNVDDSIDESRLTLLLDLRSPGCYLALPATVELGRERDIDINWLPVSVPPLRPPGEAGPQAGRGERHRRFRAEAIAREIEVYGSAQGLVLKDPYRDASVEAAVLGWLWVRGRVPRILPEFLLGLFRAYWALEIDGQNPQVIAGLLDEAGADGASFLAWSLTDGAAQAAALEGVLAERGLFAAPGYLIDGEVLNGRQHLPFIRWILDGRPGQGPI